MEESLTLFGLLMAGALAFFVGMHYATRTPTKEQQAIEERERRQQRQYLRELDEALSQWLEKLELPQLEDRMKREEVARQLSTVLLEKLWRKRCPERISKTD